MGLILICAGLWFGLAALFAPIIGNALHKMGGEYFDDLDSRGEGWND